MNSFDAFLDAYGVAAACAILFVKAVGIPVPIPGDIILLATAARAAEGRTLLAIAFVALLAAVVLGSIVQFFLARGPARRLVAQHGHRLGLTFERLERVATGVRRGGVLGIGLAVLTPGVRSAVIPACGLTGVPLRLFLPGLLLGSTIDLALHFGLGYAGSALLASLVAPSPLLVIGVLALLGLAIWLLIARRRRAPAAVAVTGWEQATCPVCLALGGLASLEAEPAVRWPGGV